MKCFWFLALGAFTSLVTLAQIPDHVYKSNIQSVKLFPFGSQLENPVLMLGGAQTIELHFDDLEGGLKNYFYTLQLCNADWKPCILNPFEYLKGFTNTRINTYRNSTIALTKYTHYSAILPDRNMTPTKSGNYLVKVYLNSDTSKLCFTKRLFVVDNKLSITTNLQAPFDFSLSRTHQKINFTVGYNNLTIADPQSQLKIFLLQNNIWQTAKQNIRPSFFKANGLEFNTEQDALFNGGYEWRWADLRTLRYQTDRVEKIDYNARPWAVTLKADAFLQPAAGYQFFNDINGRFLLETSDNANPYWQSDYALVKFTFSPPGNKAFTAKDVYLVGEFNNYEILPDNKMAYNAEKGVYEIQKTLKQAYYNYKYVTVNTDANKSQVPETMLTEANFAETENSYQVFIYYRSFTGRHDELIGYTTANTQRFRR
jgi:hypothetical protein